MQHLTGQNNIQDPFVSQMIIQMNRIEEKVDGMQSAIIQMARTEERVTTLLAADQSKTEWILKIQDRLVEIEKNDVGQRAITTRIERASWIVVTAVLTIFVGWLITSKGIM